MKSNSVRVNLTAGCIISALLIGSQAFAGQGPARETVTSRGDNVVVSTSGACVRTKWQTSDDVCAPKPAPVKVAPPVVKVGLENRTIYFDFNKATITPEEQAKLDKLVTIIHNTKSINHATVLGYTDQIGRESYNMRLSQKRADTVEQYLASHVSIPTSVLVVAGKGDSNPVVTNCSPKMAHKKRIECLAQNRRVEIQFDYTE